MRHEHVTRKVGGRAAVAFVVLSEAKDPHIRTRKVQVVRCAQDDNTRTGTSALARYRSFAALRTTTLGAVEKAANL